jgi:hypothetical protein
MPETGPESIFVVGAGFSLHARLPLHPRKDIEMIHTCYAQKQGTPSE